MMPKPTRTEATCDICGSPVWIVGSGEGTNHYESRAAEVGNERDAFLAALTEHLLACPPGYREDCDITSVFSKDYDPEAGCLSRTVGCWKRWAKEQAAAPVAERRR